MKRAPSLAEPEPPLIRPLLLFVHRNTNPREG
jgi:hypothetical protein